MPIKHRFVSLKADGSDSTLVRPGDWNEEHDQVSDGASMYLGRDATGAGDIQELPVQGTGGGDSGAIYTKAAVDAAIAAAVSGFHPFATGDVSATLAATKAGGWVLANGQGLFLGNGESNHALFLLLWALPDPAGPGGMWPVSPLPRGASAEADWLASKVIKVPDMRGCVLGMLDLTAGVNPLITNIGLKAGTAQLSLTIPNLPAHHHGQAGPAGSLGGSGGGTPIFGSSGAADTADTGGDPAATPAFSVPLPINPTQPTIGVNYFIKL